ncbi:uncharacterized protein PG998_009972 [Apiospora kogelbergensis]|uniref:uncharacterized protein n=1 Tax=Apiospora kogelbergensis TaxID=1337665 RepID=UPI003130863A
MEDGNLDPRCFDSDGNADSYFQELCQIAAGLSVQDESQGISEVARSPPPSMTVSIPPLPFLSHFIMYYRNLWLQAQALQPPPPIHNPNNEIENTDHLTQHVTGDPGDFSDIDLNQLLGSIREHLDELDEQTEQQELHLIRIRHGNIILQRGLPGYDDGFQLNFRLPPEPHTA